jgi:TolB-like protein
LPKCDGDHIFPVGFILFFYGKQLFHFSGGSMPLRRSVLLTILFPLIIFAAENSTQTIDNIAVTDLTGQGVDQASATIISDRLRTELFNTGTFKVLERQSMQDILKEQGFQQSGCASDQCLVEMGQLLGVTHIVSGTVGKLGAMFTLNVRMIDVKTGVIVYTASVDCRCAIEDVLTNSVPSIAGKIAARVSKPAAVATKPPPEQRPTTGSLRIQTDPPGAKIFVDDVDKGLTPFAKDSIAEGSHKITIELDGYGQVKSDISVSSGQTMSKKFDLKHTKAWKDSVETFRRAAEAVKNAGKPQKKHSIVPKVVFGLVAVGAGAAGVVFNYLEQGKINHDTELKQQYVSSGYSNASDNQTQLDANAKDVRNYNTMRNVCYIAACACVVGFAISFAF